MYTAGPDGSRLCSVTSTGPRSRSAPFSASSNARPEPAFGTRLSWDSGDPEMASELLHRLQTELDGAAADACIALFDGWVELSQRQHRLSIGLFVEGQRHSKACWVIVGVGAVIQDKPFAGNELEVVEAIREHGAVSGGHVEARSAARAHFHLSDCAGEAIGAEPLAEGICVGPRSEHRFACGVENSNE